MNAVLMPAIPTPPVPLAPSMPFVRPLFREAA